MDTFGYFWLHLATSGYFWLILGIFGYLRLFLPRLATVVYSLLLLASFDYFWLFFGYFWLLSLDGSFRMKEGATWRGYVNSFPLTVHQIYSKRLVKIE